MDFPSTLWSLVAEARGGKESALREFVLRYRPPVVAYCERRGLAAHADDLAQEVFVRLIMNGVLLRADPSKGRFRSLLLAVAQNVIGHHLDRENAQKRGGKRVQPLGDYDAAAPVDDPEFDREWMAHLFQLALTRLAREHPHYHEAIRLSLLDGRSHAEAAEAMGKSENDVRNYVFRGRAKLSEFIRNQVRDYSSSEGDYAVELRYLARFLPTPGAAK